jgi:hypothetical protein
MAHIVARAPDGPRGCSAHPLGDRDRYGNLILLCPNHHAEVDKDPERWSIEILHALKAEHEHWVSERLDRKLISVIPVDNSEFIDNRIASWTEFSGGHIWLAVSITPLRLGEDVVSPLDAESLAALNGLRIPDGGNSLGPVNRYHTRPNENGLLNEDLRFFERGQGHRTQLFRNGHCEYLLSLQGFLDRMTSTLTGTDKAVIHYNDLAQRIRAGVDGVYSIWGSILPFKDMTLSIFVLHVKHWMLYSCKLRGGEVVIGYPVESENLRISTVVGKNDPPRVVFETVIKQLVNHFGLVLDRVYDDKGGLIDPDKLRASV